MKQDTSYLRFGDIAKFINGKAFKPKDWKSKGLPIIRIQNLNNSSKPFNYYNEKIEKKYLVKNEDILISWSASIGVYLWNKGNAVLNQHIFKVNVDESIVDRKYFYYFAKTIVNEMKSKSHGSTMKHITKGDFENIEIPIPDIEMQKQIVKILEKIDLLNEKKNIVTNNLAKIRDSIFYKTFGDPAKNNKWTTCSLKKIIKKAQYGTSKKLITEKIGVPCLRMNNITEDGKLDVTNLKYFDFEQEIKKYTLQKGDLLFNRTNSRELVGKTTIFDLESDFVFAGYLIRLEINSEIANPFFIHSQMNYPTMKNIIRSMGKGSVGQSNINSTEIQNLDIIIPPIELQNIFCDKVDLIQKISHSNSKLKNTYEDLLMSTSNNFSNNFNRK